MAVFAHVFVVLFAVFAATSFADGDMLQDFCVADLASTVNVNGYVCKPMANVTADDFFTDILKKPGLTNNTLGALVTIASARTFPGLNTLGVSMGRIDYAPGGLNPPHVHPRGSEIVFVLYGELEVGFITTANVLFTKTIKMGEVFVFPSGLVHFQQNNGACPAAVVASFDSQRPGYQQVPATLFGATPPVPDYVLAKAFQIKTYEVQKIKAKFAPK